MLIFFEDDNFGYSDPNMGFNQSQRLFCTCYFINSDPARVLTNHSACFVLTNHNMPSKNIISYNRCYRLYMTSKLHILFASCLR